MTNGTNPEKRLKQLEHDVFSMSDMVEWAIVRSVEALEKKNLVLAREIIRDDLEIDRKRFAIEKDCMQIITSDHPEGSDLRLIVAVLGIIIELERMGDYAQGIANIALMIGAHLPLKPFNSIPMMTDKGIKMLRGSMAAFLAKDIAKARQVAREDEEMDALYEQLFRELLLFMIKHPDTIVYATRITWAAHNLERFADRITNICERVVFSVTGEIVEDMGSSKNRQIDI